ncbi:MAG TPA: magnesium transporter CorA family protein [Methanocorpusculum sp.]|nr:magnesium transporter CorA family protein [Methanocorpusculum sp.]
MIEILSAEDGKLCRQEEITPGCWVRLILPTDAELDFVCRRLNLETSDLTVLLDEEELPRLEKAADYTLVLVDTPYKNDEGDITSYQTIPAGFVLLRDCIVTISLRKNPILDRFAEGKYRGFSPAEKERFLFRFLYANAGLFVQNLRLIDKRTGNIEQHLKRATRNEELFQMLNLSKSLVYITNSLKGNTAVLEKMSRTPGLFGQLRDSDMELLDDTIIENRQASEMAANYSATISSTMSTFASIISNNVNDIMRIFTFATVLLAVPTLIAGFFGMNVAVPLTGNPSAFWIILAASFGISVLSLLAVYAKFMRGN